VVSCGEGSTAGQIRKNKKEDPKDKGFKITERQPMSKFQKTQFG